MSYTEVVHALICRPGKIYRGAVGNSAGFCTVMIDLLAFVSVSFIPIKEFSLLLRLISDNGLMEPVPNLARHAA